jgi:hypothetical protein
MKNLKCYSNQHVLMMDQLVSLDSSLSYLTGSVIYFFITIRKPLPTFFQHIRCDIQKISFRELNAASLTMSHTMCSTLAISSHYKVFLIPHVPENPRDAPPASDLNWLLTSLSDTEDGTTEDEPSCIAEKASFQQGSCQYRRPWPVYRLMEWTFSPCTLHVFSWSRQVQGSGSQGRLFEKTRRQCCGKGRRCVH